MCTSGQTWSAGSIPRSPSHESVTTDLSVFSVSSAASDAKVLRVLACKAGQGPEPNLRVASPNPEGKLLKRPSSALRLHDTDNCKDLLVGCASLCAALGVRRSFSAGDVCASIDNEMPIRNATSEVQIAEARALGACSRSCSTWVAAGDTLPSPQHQNVPLVTNHNKKVRQNYIKRRLLSTYRALERMSQSEFNLDRLEAAAVLAVSQAVIGPGPTTLAVPRTKHGNTKFVHPESAHLALTATDIERERGRPLSKYERNMMIFNWLHTLDDADPFYNEPL